MTSQVDLLDLRDAVGATVVSISGELDSSSSADLRDRLLPFIPDGGWLRLDLSGLAYISSAGLRTLLLVYRHAEDQGTRVTLAAMRADVRFVMAATGFLDLFDVEDGPDSPAEAGS